MSQTFFIRLNKPLFDIFVRQARENGYAMNARYGYHILRDISQLGIKYWVSEEWTASEIAMLAQMPYDKNIRLSIDPDGNEMLQKVYEIKSMYKLKLNEIFARYILKQERNNNLV